MSCAPEPHRAPCWCRQGDLLKAFESSTSTSDTLRTASRLLPFALNERDQARRPGSRSAVKNMTERTPFCSTASASRSADREADDVGTVEQFVEVVDDADLRSAGDGTLCSTPPPSENRGEVHLASGSGAGDVHVARPGDGPDQT
jgi:hypothetical protein